MLESWQSQTLQQKIKMRTMIGGCIQQRLDISLANWLLWERVSDEVCRLNCCRSHAGHCPCSNGLDPLQFQRDTLSTLPLYFWSSNCCPLILPHAMNVCIYIYIYSLFFRVHLSCSKSSTCKDCNGQLHYVAFNFSKSAVQTHNVGTSLADIWPAPLPSLGKVGIARANIIQFAATNRKIMAA